MKEMPGRSGVDSPYFGLCFQGESYRLVGMALVAQLDVDRFNTLRHVYDYASSVIHGGTPRVRGERNLGRDIASAQDLCRDAILRLAAADRMPDSDDWSDLTLGGGGLQG